MHPLRIAILILLAASQALAQSRPMAFRHYNRRDGMEGNMVMDVARDRQGFIWVATTTGLNRFDGVVFRTYQHEEGNPESLPFETADLLTDSLGNLWAYNQDGIYLYNPSRDQFWQASVPGIRPSIGIASVSPGSGFSFWIALNDGAILQAFPRRLAVRRVGKLEGTSIQDIADDGAQAYVPTDRGLYSIDTRSGKITRCPDTEGGGGYRHVFVDAYHRIWAAGFGTGVHQWLPDEQRFRTYRLQEFPGSLSNFISHIDAPVADRPWELWVCTVDANTGLAIFDTRTGTIRYLRHDPARPSSPAGNGSVGLLADPQGMIWYGNEGGLDKMDPLANRFDVLDLNQTSGFTRDLGIHSLLLTSENQLHIATDNGLFSWSPSAQSLVRHFLPASLSGSAAGNVCQEVAEAPGGLLALGTQDGLMIANDGEGTTWRTARPGVMVYSLATDTRGRLWAGLDTGLLVLDATGQSTIANPQIFSGSSVTALMPDGDTIMWASLSSGWNWCNTATFQASRYGQKTNAEKLLAGAVVHHFSKGSKDRMYLATARGLGVYNLRDNSAQLLTSVNGLRGNYCAAVAEDQRGRIWVLQRESLACVEETQQGLLIKNYGEAEGITTPDFAGGKIIAAPDGRLYFGAYQRIYSFHPDSLLRNATAAPLRITGIRRDDTFYHVPPGDKQSPVSFSYKDNSITFEYALLAFSGSEGSQYDYRIKGLSNAWIHAGNQHSVTLTKMPPGDYVFELRARNSDGTTAANEARLAFSVTPPFWATLWFRMLVGTAVAGIIVWQVRRRIAGIRRQAAVKHQVLEAEVKALRAQMNPHFIFNCLNTIDSYVLQNRREDASQLIGRFSKLARRILEHTAQSYVTVQQELETLRLYLQIEQERRGNAFSFTIDADPAALPKLIPPMLLQPFVENSVLHGMKGKQREGAIRVMVSLRDEQLCIVVEDNGIGRRRATELKQAQPATHKSMSMDVTHSRLEALYGHRRHQEYLRFVDLEGEATGTRVEIYLPANLTA